MPRLRLAMPVVLAVALAAAVLARAEIAQAPVSPPPASPGGQIPVVPEDPELEAPPSLQPGDAFGEEVTLPERTIIYLDGHSNWEHAFDTLAKSFQSLDAAIASLGIAPSGPRMTIYTATGDAGFSFRAAVPVAAVPKQASKGRIVGGIAVGKAPAGKALKFVHRGTYGAMDRTYEAIINYLDDKGLEAKDIFIEEYPQGPPKQASDKVKVDVFVPVN